MPTSAGRATATTQCPTRPSATSSAIGTPRTSPPRFIISGTGEAFRAFEKRYGDKLPQVRGDWTPYWEDGAGSSAAETGMNRTSAERLAQAEALWAMLNPAPYPARKFEEAWNNVLLYSEHTWGAFCSISEPANPFTVDQWAIKQSYATAANLQSRQLLSEAAQGGSVLAAARDGRPGRPRAVRGRVQYHFVAADGGAVHTARIE